MEVSLISRILFLSKVLVDFESDTRPPTQSLKLVSAGRQKILIDGVISKNLFPLLRAILELQPSSLERNL
jgi:hypothetical protein